ncbi:hypothetical protein Enr13x_67450 [Stieleria neptunia]|uniref:DUF4303 domain-containing protein n=2 Tax=Stieleria neptunia TaxID=2527979 RepID=A0A518I1A3_9BACT|nr:hypothetical protein Enr13x_67450 [Stieleria neptunia]
MASVDPSGDIVQWQRILHQELVSHLKDLRSDPAVCGFALELPSDFSNDGIISRIAKNPKVPSELDNIPSLDGWEYVPNGRTFGLSCEGLETMYRKYDEPLEDEQFYSKFGNAIYDACLSVMHECVASSEFGDILVRLLTLSDDEHPILGKAVEILNAPSSQPIAKKVLLG